MKKAAKMHHCICIKFLNADVCMFLLTQNGCHIVTFDKVVGCHQMTHATFLFPFSLFDPLTTMLCKWQSWN